MPEFVLRLSKPLKTHKGEVSEIPFREPTGADLLDLGSPYRTFAGTDGTQVEIAMEPRVFRKWVERLSGRGMEELGSLSARDIRSVYDWLMLEINPQDGDEVGN